MERRVEAVFCDDIRREIGGKQTLVGVYTQYLYTYEFPVKLAKLCIFIRATAPRSELFERFTATAILDGQVLQELTVDEETLRSGTEKYRAESEDSETAGMMIQVGIVLSPLELTQPGKLRVVCQTESEELRCPPLNIELGKKVVENARILKR